MAADSASPHPAVTPLPEGEGERTPASGRGAADDVSTGTVTSQEEIDPELSPAGLEYFKQRILKSRGVFMERHRSTAPLESVSAPEAGGPALKLTLEDMVHDVVYYNPSVEKARLEWLSSLHTTRATWGDYEPDLVGEFNYTDLERENSVLESLQQGGSQEFLQKRAEYRAGIEGRVLTGGVYNFGYTLADDKNNLTTNNQYQSFAGMTLKQPLFKGAWFGAPISKMRSAKADRRISYHGFRSRLMSILYESESAYWNLAFAEEKHSVAGESVEIARKLVKDSQERVRTGKMSELDLTEAQAGLASRLGDQAEARQEMIDAMNRLKLLLSSEKIAKDSWVKTATPIYDPAEGAEGMPVGPEFVEEVLRVQPDYLVRRYELEKEDIAVKARKSEWLPEVNARGSFGYNALGQNAEDAWEKLKKRNREVWSAGVEVRLPLGLGIEERNMLASEKFKKQSAAENLKAAEYEIASSLRSLQSRIAAFRERIQNARSVVDFRKRLLEAEFARLAGGKSTSRLIFEAEEKLSQAKQLELESWVRHREAVTQFKVVSGALLSERGLEKLDDVPVLSETLIRPRR